MPPAITAARTATSTSAPTTATTSRSSSSAPSRAPAAPRLTPAPSTPKASPQRAPSGLGPGAPLADDLRARLERGFGADLRGVRVHQGDAASRLAREAGARAFATGSHVVLGPGENARDIALIAHEVAHVLQQGGPQRPRRFSRGPGGDAYEREAQHAAGIVSAGGRVSIAPSAGAPSVQGFGVADAFRSFAERANAIPGFRMFTIVLGVNPIDMSRVDRSAANILRAVVEFIPGGALITQALDNHGIFERVGAWVEEQIRGLGMTGNTIRQAIDGFLDPLSWSDIFDLGGVWERARRIFTEPIDRIVTTVRGFASSVLGFIKDAILRPLAALAQGTRGYDLLKAVLGQDPITGEPVPRNAETLIGGFMRLIGQEEVWNNLVQSRAVPRAWAWFQGALEGLLGFVRQVPGMFVQALRTLELADIVLVPRAFARIASVFGGFVGQFLSWAGAQVMSLLQIMFEVLAPDVMPYIRRAASAFRTIINDPIGFIRNLVRAGIQGFRQFASNFLTHLRASLIAWLTGTMSGVNVHIPQAFSFIEIIKFVLSILGLTWQNIRQKLVRAIGETAVGVLETTFDVVMTLVRDGPAAAWERIQESLTNLREMVMQQIMTFVRERIVEAAIRQLLTSLNPAGAFIQAVLAIYNTIMFLVERLRQIAQVLAAFIDSISAIASGVISAAADRVERTMAGLLTLVVSFLARLVGLGRVSDAITNIINRIRAPIDRALDRVVAWIVNQARRLGRAVASGARRILDWWRARRQFRVGSAQHTLYFQGEGAARRLFIASDPKAYREMLTTLTVPDNQAGNKANALSILRELETAMTTAAGAGPAANEAATRIEGILARLANATAPLMTFGGLGTSVVNPFEIEWPKRPCARYESVWLVPRVTANGALYSQRRLRSMPGAVEFHPTSPRSVFGGPTIGIAPAYRTLANKTFTLGPHARPETPRLDSFKALLKNHGYDRNRGDQEGTTDADHVSELQMVGPTGDTFENLWPLNASENRSAGATLNISRLTFSDGTTRRVRDLGRAAYYFRIKRFLR